MSIDETSLFKYKAIDKNGRITNGALTATDEMHLYQQLESAGLSLIKSKKIQRRNGMLFGLIGSKTIKNPDKIQLYFQLAQLQQGGIPMVPALEYAGNGVKNHDLADIIVDIRRMVTEGMALSEAMARFPECFQKLEIGIIKMSEKTGEMTAAYKYLVGFLQEAEKLQAQLKKATRYPMILMAVIILAVFTMMSYVVPQIASFLKSIKGMELPFHTRLLMAVSEFFELYTPHMLVGIVVIVVGVVALRKYSYAFRYSTDSFILTVPALGKLLRKLQIARYMHVLGTLYKTGVPIIVALQEAAAVLSNEVMINAIREADQDVYNGASIARALNNTGEFEPLVIQLIEVAENSSGLDKAFDQITVIYEAEIEQSISAFIAYLEPALTFVMGGLVLWIIISVFGPIYDIFEDAGF